MDELREAKEMYFRYIGSTFHMSRDGVAEEFNRYGVPPDIVRQWQIELKLRQLAGLDSDGNWAVVYFLRHHRYTSYLRDLLAAEPRGQMWERCAYLEHLFKYIDACAGRPAQHRRRGTTHYSPTELHAAREEVIAKAQQLLLTAQPPVMTDRIEKLIAQARQRLPKRH